MTSDAEPLSAMPFESIRPAIVSLGSDIELDDVTMLLALHDDARFHRARVRELEAERDHLRGMVTECEAALLECRHEDEEITKLQRQVEAARMALEQLKQVLADVREIERKAGLVLAQEAVYARTEKTLTPNAPTAILEASKLLVDIEIACMALGLPLIAALAPQPAPTDGAE